MVEAHTPARAMLAPRAPCAAAAMRLFARRGRLSVHSRITSGSAVAVAVAPAAAAAVPARRGLADLPGRYKTIPQEEKPTRAPVSMDFLHIFEYVRVCVCVCICVLLHRASCVLAVLYLMAAAARAWLSVCIHAVCVLVCRYRGQKVPEVQDDSAYPPWVKNLTSKPTHFFDLMRKPFGELTAFEQFRLVKIWRSQHIKRRNAMKKDSPISRE